MTSETTTVLETRVVTGTGGGPEKTILNTPRFLDRVGYRTLCAYMHPPDDPGFDQLREKARAWGATLLSVPDRGPLDWTVVPRLLQICRQERVTIWHAHDYKSNLLGLMLRRFWPMRLITTVHGWDPRTRRTPLYYGIDRLCLPRYERVLCVSSDLYDACLSCGVRPERCALVENAIDARQFTRRTTVAEAKRRLGLPSGRMLVGAVGRLSPEKGYDLLIHAIDRLVRDGIDVGLVVVGEGKERGRLGALAAELGLEDRVRLPGFCADAIPWYEAMDAFGLSSHREGLPNVVLEALSMEVPVVATRVGGVPRLIRHGENGLLVEAGSVGQLTGALETILSDRSQSERLSHEGRHTVTTRYSFESRMEKIAKLYDALLARDGARQSVADRADSTPYTSTHPRA